MQAFVGGKQQQWDEVNKAIKGCKFQPLPLAPTPAKRNEERRPVGLQLDGAAEYQIARGALWVKPGASFKPNAEVLKLRRHMGSIVYCTGVTRTDPSGCTW